MKSIYFILIAFSLCNCSVVTVTHVNNSNAATQKGSRYVLGKPFIQVTPDPSTGVYSAQVVYLPDQSQVYAVESKVFLSKLALDIEVDDAGMLKKITLGNEQDAVAGDAAESIADISKEFLEARKKEQDEADKTREKLEDEVATKKIAIATLEAEIESIRTLYTGAALTTEIKEKIRGKEVELLKLRQELERLQQKLHSATGDTNALGAFNDPGENPEDTKVWGPVFFEIVDKCNPVTGIGTVALEPVQWPDKSSQMQFDTYGQSGKKPTPERSAEVALNGAVSFPIRFVAGKAQVSAVRLKEKITAVDEKKILLTAQSGSPEPALDAVNSIKLELVENNKAIKVDFAKPFGPGKFDVTLFVETSAGTKKTVTFETIVNP